MNFHEEIYKNALKTIEFLYTRSKYDKNFDFYRIFDVVNSVNDNQLASKEWLVKTLLPFFCEVNSIKSIIIIGSWYGLTSKILRYYILHDIKIFNVDVDPQSSTIGKLMYGKEHENTFFINENAIDYFKKNSKKFQIIINTSCEHMEQDDLDIICEIKHPDSLICFQSNNYSSVQSHINTCDTLNDFVKSLKVPKIYYEDQLNVNDQYDRYTVIGK